MFCLGTANSVEGAIVKDNENIQGNNLGDPNNKGFSETMNDFTQDFLAVAWEAFGENFVFSPFSLHSVLAMLTTGSTDNTKTQKELLRAFGRYDKIATLEKSYGKLVKDYHTAEVKKFVKFGNRLWTTEKYHDKILQSYLTSISKFYNGTFEKLPVEEKEAVAEVNNWVDETTNGKISNIIDSVSPDTAMLITNALYFKASWAKSFEDDKKQEFTKEDGSKVLIPMMKRVSIKQAVGRFTTNLVIGRSGSVTAVAIPYEAAEGNGILGRFEMLIIMPDHHQGLLQFQTFARINVDEPGKFDNLIELALKSLNGLRKSNHDYIIRMPEFNIDSNIGAVPMFQELGVEEAFSKGDFKGIIEDEPLKVSKIKHRATIEVTKEGTVGAAASAVELVALSASLSGPKPININKPFLFFVRDTESNAILFAGKYSSPTVQEDSE